MREFNPKAEVSVRAVQAWQILVGKAKNRQTVTYEDLSELMFEKKAAGVLAKILGHIAYYCKENNIPPLTVLVLEKETGKPSHGIPIDSATIDEEREKVYRRDWYNIYPPSGAEFAAAYKRNHR
jgi:hypothetical protein